MVSGAPPREKYTNSEVKMWPPASLPESTLTPAGHARTLEMVLGKFVVYTEKQASCPYPTEEVGG